MRNHIKEFNQKKKTLLKKKEKWRGKLKQQKTNRIVNKWKYLEFSLSSKSIFSKYVDIVSCFLISKFSNVINDDDGDDGTNKCDVNNCGGDEDNDEDDGKEDNEADDDDDNGGGGGEESDDDNGDDGIDVENDDSGTENSIGWYWWW